MPRAATRSNVRKFANRSKWERTAKGAAAGATALVSILAKKYMATTNDGKPQNDDTIINLNSNNSAVALFNKRKRGSKSKKSRIGLKKKKVFNKKVKKALQGFQRWSNFHITFTDDVSATAGSVSRVIQNIEPEPTSTSPMAIGIGWGALYTTTKDHAYIAAAIQGIGHVEDNTVVDDTYENPNNVGYYIRAVNSINIVVTTTGAVLGTTPCWFDVYECVAARNIPTTHASYNTPAKTWSKCLGDCQIPIESVGVPQGANMYDKGQIPSNCPEFSKFWTILKVTRFFTEREGTQFQYDLHTSGNISQRTSLANYALKGITKCIMVVAQPVGGPITNLKFAFSSAKNIKFKMDKGAGVINAKPQVEWNFTRITTV